MLRISWKEHKSNEVLNGIKASLKLIKIIKRGNVNALDIL